MTRIAIVYHSGSGHTAAQAKAVAEGAGRFAGADVACHKVEDYSAWGEGPWQALHDADAIVFGSPTYMGSVSGPMKTFMDMAAPAWQQQLWADKIAAGFTNSASWSGDKLNTLTTMAIFAAQHSMLWIGLGLKPGFHAANDDPDSLNRLGGFLGAMAQSNADQGSDMAPPDADRRTAAYLGERVARAAARWRAGGG